MLYSRSCSPLLFPPSTHTHARTHTHNSLENNTSFLADSRVRSFGSLLWTNFEIDSLIFCCWYFAWCQEFITTQNWSSQILGEKPPKVPKIKVVKDFFEKWNHLFWLKMNKNERSKNQMSPFIHWKLSASWVLVNESLTNQTAGFFKW